MEDGMELDEEKLQRKAEKALDETLDTDFGTELEQNIKDMEKQKEKLKDESESKIPFTWDPREIQYLTQNRNKMSNEELKDFLEKDHEVQEEIRDIEGWDKFSRREERFLVQNHTEFDPEELADKLERDKRKVKLKMRTLGLKIDNF